MIGFKRVSFKYVMIIFLIFVGFILLVNIDLKNKMVSWEDYINLYSNVPMNILLAKLKKLCFIKNAAAQFKERNI